MNWLNFDLRKALTISLLFCLPLISINNQQTTRNYGWYDRPFSFIAGVVEHSFFAFSEGIRGTTRQYIDLIDIKRENKDLHSQIEELRTRLQQMNEAQNESNRLRKLLDFREQTKMDLVASKIMSRDLLSEHSTIRIDKGTAHGLKSGMAVISTEGVVGHIFRPETYTSHVLLVNDRYSVVDGLVARSRARGLIEGRSQSTLSMIYVQKSEDIQKGDIIVTSGLDNVFPKGFPVAKVEYVENKPYAVALKVDLKPVVDSDKIEEVFVIVNANNQDVSERIKQ